METNPSGIEVPTVVVLNDYDGYFERLVRNLVATKQTPFRHKEIRIDSGPYRSVGCAVRQPTDHPDVVIIDFYSATRNGFGGLSSDDLKGIQNLL